MTKKKPDVRCASPFPLCIKRSLQSGRRFNGFFAEGLVEARYLFCFLWPVCRPVWRFSRPPPNGRGLAVVSLVLCYKQRNPDRQPESPFLYLPCSSPTPIICQSALGVGLGSAILCSMARSVPATGLRLPVLSDIPFWHTQQEILRKWMCGRFPLPNLHGCSLTVDNIPRARASFVLDA